MVRPRLTRNNAKQAIIGLTMLTLLVSFDAISKYIALTLPYGEAVSVIGSLYILPTLNKNADMIIYGFNFTIIASFLLIAVLSSLLIFGFRLPGLSTRVILLGMAGTLGNLVDRLYYGKVVDFIYIQQGDLFTSIFNFADLFLYSAFLWALANLVRSSSK